MITVLEIKLVLTLYLSASSFEYYDWEDAMEDFLWGHGWESRMKTFFAKRIFSRQVLQWWINLQQQHITRAEDPYRTWTGMKVMLQHKFDPLLKLEKKIVVADGTQLLDTIQTICSSWADAIVGNECLEVTSLTIKHSDMKKIVGAALSKHKESERFDNVHEAKGSTLNFFAQHVPSTHEQNFISPKTKNMSLSSGDFCMAAKKVQILQIFPSQRMVEVSQMLLVQMWYMHCLYLHGDSLHHDMCNG
jgi:hypothetical protein